MEILIADGGSTDSTREIIKELHETDKRVTLVENPGKYQSFGLNRMIELAKGEVFLRADGHCHYNEDYIEKCVTVMMKTDARNVGGAQRYKATNRVQAGIALAVKSILGNGGAKYMDENYEGYSDTVFLGCFRTEDLRELGGFNTENITNQDSELNLRLIEKYGETVYVSPEIKSWYYPRSTFYKLFRQYFRYGRGRFLTLILHPKSSPIRGILPFISLIFLIIYLIADLLAAYNLFSLQLLTFISLAILFESLRIVTTKRQEFKSEIWNNSSKPPGILICILSFSFTLILMQLGHFFGFSFQLLKTPYAKNLKW